MLHTTQPATRYIPYYIIALLLGLVLAGCKSLLSSPAFAMSTPFAPAAAPEKPALEQPARSIAPTATAVVFELRPTSTPFPTGTPVPANHIYGPDNFPNLVNPLTGQEIAYVDVLNRRPVAVKVTNYPRSVRPQWGLSLADHVYEYYIGDEMSRFIAVYYGIDAERVGPVRSARFFDEHILRMYKAILVFGSADERVLNPWLESDLLNYLVLERAGNCPPLCRIGSKEDYNTLYVNTQQLSQYITGRGTNNGRQDLTGLRFEQFPPYGNQDAAQISIYFTHVSYNQWEYDPDSRRYLRFQDAQDDFQAGEKVEPLADSLTGEQIAADNLVVLLVPHEYFIHTSTTEMVKMNFTGQGNGFAFREGKAYPVIWRRDRPEALLTLVFPGGRPYPLKPGNTWFEVLGETSTVENIMQTIWRFEFDIP